jgi:hypothetical protein
MFILDGALNNSLCVLDNQQAMFFSRTKSVLSTGHTTNRHHPPATASRIEWIAFEMPTQLTPKVFKLAQFKILIHKF